MQGIMKWEKTDVSHHADGTHVITYRAEGCEKILQSRKRPIPHANREGSWLYTSYYLIDPQSGTEKEYHSLRNAKLAAEAG